MAYDDYGDDYPVGYYPVGYYPVGAVTDHRSGGGSTVLPPGSRRRPGGVVSSRPRRTVSRGERVSRRSGPITPREEDMVYEALPYFGDDPRELALARQVQQERALLEEQRERLETEAQIRRLQKERAKLAMGGVQSGPNESLGGSARGLVHGSMVYSTEVPLSLTVGAGLNGTLTYKVNRWFRIWRVLAADAETQDNFRVLGFTDNGRQLREAYSAGGGVAASFFSQADEKLTTLLPWISTNNDFGVQVVNTDGLNPHDASFIVQAIESEIDPANFDEDTAANVEAFVRRMVMA